MEDDPANPLDNLYRLKGAVEARLAMLIAVDKIMGQPLYPAVYKMGGLIIDMMIGPGLVHPMNVTTGGREVFYLPMLIECAMNVADPYAVT